jgi:hypothetical protein
MSGGAGREDIDREIPGTGGLEDLAHRTRLRSLVKRALSEAHDGRKERAKSRIKNRRRCLYMSNLKVIRGVTRSFA